MNNAHKNAVLILKVGVAFAFLYPAFSAFTDPAQWLGYVPMWIGQIFPRETFLTLFSSFEIFVALGILFTNRILPPIVAGLVLATIVIVNPREFSVIFRDLSIACMSFALAFLLRTR